MKKVFHFDAPRQKYHCDAAISGLKIDAYFVDFEGIWQAELEVA